MRILQNGNIHKIPPRIFHPTTQPLNLSCLRKQASEPFQPIRASIGCFSFLAISKNTHFHPQPALKRHKTPQKPHKTTVLTEKHPFSTFSHPTPAINPAEPR
jgi:hypothetical protein